MLTIKRYPNRKLYNTQEKRYITLDEIGGEIRRGEEIQVLDHVSGEEITTLILTQVILEQEKKKSGSFPHSLLAGLVRSGEDTLNQLQNTFLSTFGESGEMVDAEIRRRIEALVERQLVDKAEAVRWIEFLCAPEGGQPHEPSTAEKNLPRLLKTRGIPSRDEIVRLSQDLDEITRALDVIAEQRKAE
jgi:polyhydroxyalkanoate synthesis repressor PhaR